MVALVVLRTSVGRPNVPNHTVKPHRVVPIRDTLRRGAAGRGEESEG